MEYLGYIIIESGIKMDPVKINMIKGWPTLRNILEVQFFLRFANFYCRFIEKYFEVTTSLINLIKKG